MSDKNYSSDEYADVLLRQLGVRSITDREAAAHDLLEQVRVYLSELIGGYSDIPPDDFDPTLHPYMHQFHIDLHKTIVDLLDSGQSGAPDALTEVVKFITSGAQLAEWTTIIFQAAIHRLNKAA